MLSQEEHTAALRELAGMELNRIWANGIAVYTNPESCLIVFSEQLSSAVPDDKDELLPIIAKKNVASLVLTPSAAKILRDALVSKYGAAPEAEGDNAD